MATARLLRSGLFITFLVICGAAACSARADQKSALDNAKGRLEAARKVYEAMIEEIKYPSPAQTTELDPEKLYTWSRRWMDAQREVVDKEQNRIAAAEGHLKRMKELEKMFKDLYDMEHVALRTALEAEFYRLEAEKWLSEAKTK